MAWIGMFHEDVVAWVNVESLSLDRQIRQIHAVIQHKVSILRNERARQAQAKVVVIAEQNRTVPATADSSTGPWADTARGVATTDGAEVVDAGANSAGGSPGKILGAHEDALVAGLGDAVGALLETGGVLDGFGVGVAGCGDVGEVGVFGGVGVEPVGVGAEDGIGDVVVVAGDVDDGATLDERAGPGQVGEGKMRHGDHAVLGGDGGGEGGCGEAEDHGGDGDHFVVEVANKIEVVG